LRLLDENGLNVELEPYDVALMMDDVKSARLCETPDHRDSWVDKAGYSACGAEVALDALQEADLGPEFMAAVPEPEWIECGAGNVPTDLEVGDLVRIRAMGVSDDSVVTEVDRTGNCYRDECDCWWHDSIVAYKRVTSAYKEWVWCGEGDVPSDLQPGDWIEIDKVWTDFGGKPVGRIEIVRNPDKGFYHDAEGRGWFGSIVAYKRVTSAENYGWVECGDAAVPSDLKVGDWG
jgi:hypothetical protein